MKLAIIDYGAGNLCSARNAVERTVRDAGLDCDVIVTSDADDLNKVDSIILPGVGAYGHCISSLKSVDGMVEALEENILKKAKPFLGICVGMHLLSTEGHEHGIHKGLGWIDGTVEPIDPNSGVKIPHMGWNDLDVKSDHPVLKDIPTGSDVYFVHSYHYALADQKHLLASVNYGTDIAAVVGRDNMIGTQFHPEKSQEFGLKILENFLKWRP